MKLGMLTVMMADQPVEKVLDLMVSYKMEAVEFYSGAMFPNAHCNPDELLKDDAKLKNFKKMLSSRNMFISALSCHGNPLHSDPKIGPVHAEFIRKTILLAEKLEVDRIIGFAGCPAGCEKDTMPNWVHKQEYWSQYLINLRMIGYDYVLSIEHEDSLMSAAEGLDKAVNYLNTIILRQKPGPMTWT